MTLTQAIESGDQYAILVATRSIVAEQLQASQSGRDTASLARQMRELTERIAELERAAGKRGKANPVDAARKAVKHAR